MRFAEPHTQAATKAARPAVRQNKYKVGNAAIERIATGFRWAEGPVYIRDYRRLIWSDIPNNRMMSWNEEDGHVSVFRQPSNYTNGNTRDRQGRLLSCEHDGTITTIIDSFDGKKLNAPNDVVVAADDSIWFTDPGYGIFGNYEGHLDKSEQPPRVYRVDGKTGKATIVIDSLLGERASGRAKR
jgi:gluconolactonase